MLRRRTWLVVVAVITAAACLFVWRLTGGSLLDWIGYRQAGPVFEVSGSVGIRARVPSVETSPTRVA